MMRKFRDADDEGMAIVMAMLVMLVVTGVIFAMIAYISETNRGSGRDRQRAADVAAAEAGVDAGYVALQATGANLPCTTLTGGVNGAPDQASYSATITYIYTDGTQSTACPSTMTAKGAPVSALIRSQGTAAVPAPGLSTARTFESLVNLKPILGNGFNKAIFSNGNLTTSNKTTVNGNQGSNADIYTNATFTCQNNEIIHGSLYAQGGANFANSCSIDGDLYTKLDITMDSSQVIGGRMMSSQGNITWKQNQNPTVGGTIQAKGTITNDVPCTNNPGKCFPGATIPDPPYLPFPIVRATSPYIDEWLDPAKGGYTQIADPFAGAACTKANVKTWFGSQPQTLTSKSLLITNCAIVFANSVTLSLKNDLAIFSYGGFTSQNQLNINSTVTGTNHKIYWIVPYEAAASIPCTSPGINFQNNVSITSDVDMMAYSPCSIYIANNSTHFGQIYGGSDVNIVNQFNMYYEPLPMFGVDTSNLPTLGYNVDVLYKRETI
jgi:hypothetical protein